MYYTGAMPTKGNPTVQVRLDPERRAWVDKAMQRHYTCCGAA